MHEDKPMFKLTRTTVLAVVLAIGLVALTPGGCRRRSGPRKPRVTLIMKSLANEFFKTMEDGARAHHAANPDRYELTTVGIKNEQDVAKQIELVELKIGSSEAIVIAPADSKALVQVCKKAIDAGVVVVNIDNKLDDAVLKEQGVTIPFVGPDNRKGARMAAEYLAKKLNPGDKVAILEGIPSAFNAIQRKAGFVDAMNAAGMQIVSSQSAYWEMEKAEPIVSALITEHPDLKAVLCANDSMALGAVAALKAAGKSDEVLVTGFDNILAVQKLLKQGKILCTVDQHADRLAVYGIEYALEMLQNKTAPRDKQTPVDLITAETLK